MKKNKAMRAAGVLVIATLLTTCLTAGTFAKYTTTDSATDSARVAKFGVTVVANGSLYGSAYAANHADTPVVADNTVTVKASNGDNVVAPGTKNDSGIGFAVNGKPEVDVKITGTVEAEDIFLKAGTYATMVKKPAGVVTAENFDKLTKTEELYTKANGTYTKAAAFDANATAYYVLKDEVTVDNDYYPVVYTYDSNSTKTTGTINDAAAAIAEKLNGGKAVTGEADTNDVNKKIYTVAGYTVKNNKDLATALKLSNEKITWAWAFEKVDNEVVDTTVDAKDTILGNLQAGNTDDRTIVKVARGTDSETSDATVTISSVTDGTDYNLKTNFSVSISVDQVD